MLHSNTNTRQHQVQVGAWVWLWGKEVWSREHKGDADKFLLTDRGGFLGKVTFELAWLKSRISKAWIGNMVEQKLAAVVSSMRTGYVSKHNRLRSVGVHVQVQHTETISCRWRISGEELTVFSGLSEFSKCQGVKGTNTMRSMQLVRLLKMHYIT